MADTVETVPAAEEKTVVPVPEIVEPEKADDAVAVVPEEAAPAVEEAKKDDDAPEIVEAAENGNANGSANGNGVHHADEEKATNGEAKETNGTNGHAIGDNGHAEEAKEAPKRKADEDVPEPIEVSAEKIAKLKDAADETEEVATVPEASA